MLGRLLRLGLDEDRTLEADLVLVVDDKMEEAAGLGELALEIGVEQRLIAFAPTPHDVIFATQFLGDIEAMLHLGGAIGEDIRIGIGGRPRHEAAVGEHIGGAPEEFDAGLAHLLQEVAGNGRDIAVEFLERCAFGRDIEIMESEIGNTQ